MKRLFLVLVMCVCGFLYADTRSFSVGRHIPISFAWSLISERELNPDDYKDYTVSAVYPYADGYLVELYDENHDVIKFYVSSEPGTIVAFYSWISDKEGYKNVIAAIKKCRDNSFVVEYSEY